MVEGKTCVDVIPLRWPLNFGSGTPLNQTTSLGLQIAKGSHKKVFFKNDIAI